MENITREQLERNIADIRHRMDAAAVAAGRSPADIRLCAASNGLWNGEAEKYLLAHAKPIE